MDNVTTTDTNTEFVKALRHVDPNWRFKKEEYPVNDDLLMISESREEELNLFCRITLDALRKNSRIGLDTNSNRKILVEER